MRQVALMAAAILVVLAQASWLPALRPFGVVPNLALVFIVLAALEGTASTALVLAVGMGCALDLASGANFGLWTGILVLAALVAGLLHRAGWELSGGLVSMVMVVIGTLLIAVIIWLGLANTVAHWPAGQLAGRLSVELMLNLLLTVAVRPVVRWLMPNATVNAASIG